MKDNNENQPAILYKFNPEALGNWNEYKLENYSVKEMQNKQGKRKATPLVSSWYRAPNYCKEKVNAAIKNFSTLYTCLSF